MLEFKQNKVIKLKNWQMQKSELYNEITENSSTDNGKNKKSFQTIGEIFDCYRQLGYDKLPDDVQINAPGWLGNPSQWEVSDHNRDKHSN